MWFSYTVAGLVYGKSASFDNEADISVKSPSICSHVILVQARTVFNMFKLDTIFLFGNSNSLGDLNANSSE